jgi:hypothetical protein
MKTWEAICKSDGELREVLVASLVSYASLIGVQIDTRYSAFANWDIRDNSLKNVVEVAGLIGLTNQSFINRNSRKKIGQLIEGGAL